MLSTSVASLLAAALHAGPAELPLPFEPIPRWEMGTAAGGGWDSNPLGDAASSSSGFATARAWVTRRFELGGADDLRLQLHYDGVRYAAASPADLDRPELGVEWDHFFGEKLLLRVAARGALRDQGDSARSGWDASARALLRVSTGEVVGLRFGLGWYDREARDASYGGSSGRVDVGFDLALWRGASAIAGYGLELGTDLVSSTTSGTGRRGGAGTAGGGSAAGLGETALRQVVAVDVLQSLRGGFFLQGGYGYSAERGTGTWAEAHTALFEVGWRR